MRDIIQVERQDGLGNGPDSGSGIGSGSGPDSIAQLARVADELLPPLVARLGVSELAEIEVRQGTWRVRIRRAAARDGMTQMATAHPAAGTSSGAPSSASAPTGGSHGGAHPGTLSGGAHGASTGTPSDQPMARSTAVGYFGLRPGLAVGHRVARGDALGWVDVLGVRMEIDRARRRHHRALRDRAGGPRRIRSRTGRDPRPGRVRCVTDGGRR